MKNRWIGSALVLVFLLSVSWAFAGQEERKEKLWISGKITGQTRGKVVTVRLVGESNGYQMETSTNKYGWYAFSDPGQGHPSDYRLIIFLGENEIKRVSLDGIAKGSRVPDIFLNQ